MTPNKVTLIFGNSRMILEHAALPCSWGSGLGEGWGVGLGGIVLVPAQTRDSN